MPGRPSLSISLTCNQPISALQLPGYEVNSWFGIGPPTNTPADIVDRLNKEINAGLADPKIKARLADAAPFIATPAAFGKFIAMKPRSGAS